MQASSAAAGSASGHATTAQQSHLDPSLRPFTDSSFDPAAFLNDTLPPLTLSNSQPHASKSPGAVPLTDLSSRIQSLLSQLGSQNVRLSDILTQLTDEILRSGGRLAYEVEVLRGETISLADALTENLSEDIVKFAPGVDREASAEDDGSEKNDIADGDGDTVKEPPFITQLRTLTKVRGRLEEVVQTFGDAMEWPLPPSELSLTSSFISVSAPEPGSESYSREERGQEVAKKLRAEISELLDSNGGGDAGLAAATERLETLRSLGNVWKGTSEEKARNRFLDGLAKTVDDRRRTLEGQRASTTGRDQIADEPASIDHGAPGGGLFRNLQRIRDEMYLE
ncbi:hypothetical protein BGW36DRAFT_382667 [Talaromyces proteolyticus]|uniref:Uncharacterized protein n=1 Tax=Talaromyces proteolyticus TaxID=1131652 RepID=A0AAD4KPM7_9EURO|nr:uncharacterized protein BGW36DRAFT_382667 [Talaromyces proteolyticus]KAH8695423.1 hypothetical protein BGW36DRAFT_382667 [Talaromyces proteolyticus]